MTSKLRRSISNTLINLPGWHTNRKIVVIESDDWGSIRMPSRYVYDKMLRMGVRVDKCPYNKYDSLASEQDLVALFDVLYKYTDANGNHPVITANTVVANPDFDLIKQSDYLEYYYEPFIVTLNKYTSHQNSFSLWKQGIDEKVFKPQFHGREHVNVTFWLTLLREKRKEYLFAFENGFWGLGPNIVDNLSQNIQASFDANNFEELEHQKTIIKEGLRMFEKIFGYKSDSFIANNFIWSPELNQTLKTGGVEAFQGMKYQLLPKMGRNKRMKIFNYTGKKNNLNQTYFVRNCVFEPSQFPEEDNVGKCLDDIRTSFFFRKPAIITSHRLNFIGYIDEKNRNSNLKSFSELLNKILIMWPEVVFMSSDQLVNEILRN